MGWAAEAGVTAHFYIEQLQVFNIRTVSWKKSGHGIPEPQHPAAASVNFAGFYSAREILGVCQFALVCESVYNLYNINSLTHMPGDGLNTPPHKKKERIS